MNGEGRVQLGERRMLGARFGRLAAEIAGVIFAVLVALAADEWREERQLDQRANAVRAAVLAEVAANRDELESVRESLADASQVLATAADRMDAGEEASFDLQLLLPDFSDAAWSIMQSSDAASRLELPWLVRTARLHETQEAFRSASNRIMDSLTDLRADETSAIPRLRAQLDLLLQLYPQLIEDYEEALSDR